MTFEEVAALPIPHRLAFVRLALFDDRVVLGGLSESEAAETSPSLPWGALVCELSSGSVGQFSRFPLGGHVTGLDGCASPLALVGDSVAVIVGEDSHSLLGVWDRSTNKWSTYPRNSNFSQAVAGYAPGAAHVVCLNEGGTTAQLYLIELAGERRVRILPAPQVAGALAVAVNAQLSHTALAGERAVVCSSLDGAQVRSWPCEQRLFALCFAEDDLAVFGAWNRGIALYQWGGEVQYFEVPSMRPRALDQKTRLAFFSNQKTREFVELDLSSGRERSSGVLPHYDSFDVDLQRRRLVTWSDQEQLVRLFQMIE